MPQIQEQEIEVKRQEKEAHQKALRAKVFSEAPQQLKRQLDHISRAGASSWLSSTPLKESDLHLSKSNFRDLIRLRYLLPLENMPLTCVCGKDYTITHALTCATGGFIIKRHNDVRDYLAYLLNEVCADLSIEPHLVQVREDETTSTNKEDAARLDIVARLSMSGFDFLLLILQSSNSFDLNAFFQVLFNLILTVFKGDIQRMALASCCPIGVF